MPQFGNALTFNESPWFVPAVSSFFPSARSSSVCSEGAQPELPSEDSSSVVHPASHEAHPTTTSNPTKKGLLFMTISLLASRAAFLVGGFAFCGDGCRSSEM
jgi:hypothetical protein